MSSSQPQQPVTRFTALLPSQTVVYLDSFTLESGVTLRNVPVAYKTWGTLNETGDNVMIICHALSGSADVEDWWGPLLGPGKSFDTSKYFIFCGNVLGSPYGTASPVTLNPETGKPYGPEFPLATIRDDVRLHRGVLDSLGVKQIQFAIGGSMGGMQVLEWAFYGPDYVRNIVAIATSGRHSAWCISWGEAQRQAIYTDMNYCDGYYPEDKPPNNGLAAARMQALLTYRSRDSFESRFSRKVMPHKPPHAIPRTPSEVALVVHNEGHKVRLHESKGAATAPAAAPQSGGMNGAVNGAKNGVAGKSDGNGNGAAVSVYSAQSYLRYQGDKFVNRFDANCYIAITRKMDTHDVSRGRGEFYEVLGSIAQPCLIIGIQTDGLFTINEQHELAEHIPNARMEEIYSGEGHDGFLLEFEQMNRIILRFLKEKAPGYYENEDGDAENGVKGTGNVEGEVKVTKNSVFGEAEDVLMW
ncbi:homoserine O- acetyltransferase [Borealophlyctis nickersoniae]|nr:homoserine O- acetyltransferase [Borealophlyctis nickersoniae]